jgi:hypothetical protein
MNESEARERAAEYRERSRALAELRDEVLEADSIGETRLSKLFHEARTNRPDNWSAVTAFIDVEDGEAVVSKVSKLREGDWTPETRKRHDALISIGIRPFMDSDMFRTWAQGQIDQVRLGLEDNASHYEERAHMSEHYGDE